MPDAERERGKLEESGLRRRELGGRHKLLYAISLLKISTYEGGSTGSDTKKITKKRLMTAGAWSRTWGATHKTQPKKAAYEGGSLGGATYCSKAAYEGGSLVTHLGGDAQNTAQKSGL